MEEEENPEELFREAEIKYTAYRKQLPGEMKNGMDELLEWMHFYYDVLLPCCEELKPQLYRLMLAQYPDIGKFKEPIALAHIEDFNSLWLPLIWNMRDLYRDCSNKVNPLEKHPRLEEFREFYCHPKPTTMDDLYRNRFVDTDDEAREKNKEEQNREMLKFFNWEQRRYHEFYEIIQAALQKYLPEIFNIEDDYWVIYAVIIRDEYEFWKSLCSEFQTTIEYEMPEESIMWPHKKWKEELSRRYAKYHDASMQKRLASIEKG